MRFFLFLILTLYAYKSVSQELFYNVYNYTSRELDLDMLVFEMVQDRSGLIWIRDYNSIGIFDGRKFRNVTKQLEKIAGGSIEVFDIHADLDGQIWISCNFGVFRYTAFIGFVRLNIDYHNKSLDNITAIGDDCNHNLYLGTTTGDILKVNKETGQILKEYQLPTKSIVKYAHVSNDDIWVCSNFGVSKCNSKGDCVQLYTFKPYNNQNTFADNRFQKVKSLNNGQIIATNNENKLLVFDTNGTLIDSITFDLKSTEKFVNDWIEISDRNIFVGTYDGIYNYNMFTKELRKKQNEYLIKNQFYNTQILSLLLTKNHVIYLGASTNISKINIQNEQFQNFNYKYPSRTMLVKEIPYLGHQWVIVTEYDGILLFDPKELNSKRILALPDETIVWAVYDSLVPCLWIATNDNILKVDVNHKTKIIGKYPTFGRISSMATDKHRLWFVSDNVLYALNKNHHTIVRHSDNSQSLNIVACSDDGTVIAGGTNIYIMVHDTLQKLSLLEDPVLERINSLFFDHDNSIYFTSSRKLIKYNLKTKIKKIYDSSIGLPNEGLSYVVYDDDTHLWICTRASGLCRFNIKDESVQYFKEGEGLVDNLYLFGISVVKKGLIAAHRWQFFSYYQPKAKEHLLAETPFLLSNILVNKKNQTTEVLKTGKITVPSVNSLISMDITYPSHLNQQLITLQYRLKSEHDTIWSEIGDDHKLVISQLAPGKYNLELKAINNQFPKDSMVSSLSIISLSPFYLRWWFFVLVLLSSYIAIYMVYRYKQMQRKKIENLRSRISKDLHDEMGSNLSSIMLLGEIAIIKNDNSQKILPQIVEKTKYVMQSMSDIVWSINPGNDTLPNIIQKIQTTCFDVLEPADVNINFNIAEDVNHISIEMAKRQAFYMIFKESINNCAKYSKAQNVTFSIKLQKNKIVASLEDDGIGFDITTINMGNGLKNIVSRAKVIGGQAIIDSSPMHGTKILVTIPIN